MKMRSALSATFMCCLLASGPVLGGDAPTGPVRLSIKATDPGGGKLAFSWKQIAGPTIEIAEPNACRSIVENGQTKYISESSFVPAEPGTYKFEVTVTNESGQVSKHIKVREVILRAPSGVVEPEKIKPVWESKTQPPAAPQSNILPIAAVDLPKLTTAEGIETVLDASPSTDPDHGPQPLSFIWRAPDQTQLHSDGPLARFTPQRSGTYKFQVRVSDGQGESEPVEVKVSVVKAGKLPVAIAQAPASIKAAQRGRDVRHPSNTLLILDGSQSQPGAAAREEDKDSGKPSSLSYTWKQVSGADMGLKALDLARERVGLRIYLPGTYHFRLQVSDGRQTSAPAYVKVRVDPSDVAQPEQPEGVSQKKTVPVLE